MFNNLEHVVGAWSISEILKVKRIQESLDWDIRTYLAYLVGEFI